MEIQRPDKPRSAKANIRKVTPAPTPKKPVTNTGSRAAKTAAAREAAAKRNAAMVSPPKPTATKKPKTAASKARRTPVKVQKTASREEINRKISTQTPSQRHKVKSSKRVGGSIKNLEIKHHTKSSKHSFRVKKKQQAMGKLLLARLTLFFVIFALMFSLVAGIFALRLKAGGTEEGKAYTLQLGEDVPEDAVDVAEEDKPTYVDIPKGCAIRYDTLYIPVSALSEMCELTVTGTTEDLRYIPRGSVDQSIRFEIGTNIAYVNGAKVRMIAPSFISGGKLYIPLDFMQKYSKGLIINTDEANAKITISRYVEGYDAETDGNIYSTLTFGLCATSPLVAIPEPTE